MLLPEGDEGRDESMVSLSCLPKDFHDKSVEIPVDQDEYIPSRQDHVASKLVFPFRSGPVQLSWQRGMQGTQMYVERVAHWQSECIVKSQLIKIEGLEKGGPLDKPGWADLVFKRVEVEMEMERKKGRGRGRVKRPAVSLVDDAVLALTWIAPIAFWRFGACAECPVL